MNICQKYAELLDNYWIIKFHNIKPDFHLNQSELDLNKKGNTIFESNIRRYLNNLN